MANLVCIREPQNAGNVSLDTVYPNATMYTQQMAITEEFNEAHYVVIINDAGAIGVRYRASLFNEVPAVETVNINSNNFNYEVEFFDVDGRISRDNITNVTHLRIKVYATVNNRRILIFDNTGTNGMKLVDPTNAFSCGVRLLAGVQSALHPDFFTDAAIMSKLEAYERTSSTPERVINIIEVDTDVISQNIQNALKTALLDLFRRKVSSAFIMVSMETSTFAYRMLREGFFDTLSSNIVNPNSDNEIMIGIINNR